MAKAKKSKTKKPVKAKIKAQDPYLVIVAKAISEPHKGVTWELPKWCPEGYVSILWGEEEGYCGFRAWKQTVAPDPEGCAIVLKKYPEFLELVDALLTEWQLNYQDEDAVGWDFKGILVDGAGEWITLDLNDRKILERA